MPETELQTIIRRAIGYDAVPVSITDHPEIRLVHRTAADADGLVERISAAIEKKYGLISDEESYALVQQAYAEIHDQEPWRVYSVAEVKQIVYPLTSALRSRPGISTEEMLRQRVEQAREAQELANTHFVLATKALSDYQAEQA